MTLQTPSREIVQGASGAIPYGSTTMAVGATESFILSLGDVINRGLRATEPSNERREIRNCTSVIAEPIRRLYVLPHRGNNPLASMVEGVWMLAGRNDIGFLLPYSPRAVDYSDDGVTWRAGYGPRVRDWHGIDQVRELIDLLARKSFSRRATIALFDPQRDWVESRDVPCHSWIHPMIQRNRLALQVATRSNDLFWGVTGANTFELWLLQTVIANSVGVAGGAIATFCSALQIYDWHYTRARTIYDAYPFVTLYDLPIAMPECSLDLSTFDKRSTIFFDAEAELREGSALSPAATGDEFLDTLLLLLQMFHLAQRRTEWPSVAAIADSLPDSDMKLATLDYLERRYPSLLAHIDLSPVAADFLAATRARGEGVAQRRIERAADLVLDVVTGSSDTNAPDASPPGWAESWTPAIEAEERLLRLLRRLWSSAETGRGFEHSELPRATSPDLLSGRALSVDVVEALEADARELSGEAEATPNRDLVARAWTLLFGTLLADTARLLRFCQRER